MQNLQKKKLSHSLRTVSYTHPDVYKRQDIGTVKIPRWIKDYTGKDFQYEWSSGTEFPEDLKNYGLIVHCGGCMLNEREMKYRQKYAEEQGVPMTNYGILIAQTQGILKRSLEPFPDIQKLLEI